MYNKIFTKILDSSIWLEPTPTRIVWLTFLAAMNEDGFVQFASVANLAHRAILPIPETTEAVRVLESPDENSSDPEHEGRRIERVPGGWMVLNAVKYRDLVTRSIIQEQTRLRVAAHRERKKCNAPVTHSNEKLTPSDTDTDTDTDTISSSSRKRAKRAAFVPPTDGEWNDFCGALTPKMPDEEIAKGLDHYRQSGWRMKGGARIVDWECTARNWHRNWRNYSANPVNGRSNARPLSQMETNATSIVHSEDL